MTRFQAMRLIWIDAWLERSEFLLRRQHLMEAFDISTPQASYDLKQFNNAFPGRLTFDRSAKGFRATNGSAPAFDPWMHESVFAAGRAAAAACATKDVQP
jgi:hypothetical protein